MNQSNKTQIEARSPSDGPKFSFKSPIRLFPSHFLIPWGSPRDLARLSQQWASVEWGVRSAIPVQGVGLGTSTPPAAFPVTPLGSTGMKNGISFTVGTRIRVSFVFSLFPLFSKGELQIQLQEEMDFDLQILLENVCLQKLCD